MKCVIWSCCNQFCFFRSWNYPNCAYIGDNWESVLSVEANSKMANTERSAVKEKKLKSLSYTDIWKVSQIENVRGRISPLKLIYWSLHEPIFTFKERSTEIPQHLWIRYRGLNTKGFVLVILVSLTFVGLIRKRDDSVTISSLFHKTLWAKAY